MCTQLYFDYAATTPVKKEVLEEMLPFFNINFGNPSSIYNIGRQGRNALDIARDRVAKINYIDDYINDFFVCQVLYSIV